MIDKITYLETDSEKFPLAFTLNVMESIQDEYGTLSEWSELIRNQKEPNIKALKFLLPKQSTKELTLKMVRSMPRPAGDAGMLTNRKRHRELRMEMSKATMSLTGKLEKHQLHLRKRGEL